MSYLGEDISKLGFGMMRLPRDENKKILIPEVSDMVDEFLAAGCTYFDTARAYGESESATRRALVERHPRDSFVLATKNAAWLGSNSREEAISAFDRSLEETGAGYFDYYLLHNVGENRTAAYDKWGMWEWAAGLKKKGLIRHFGFSYHDNADNLRILLEKHPEAEFVQLQINWADWEDKSVQARKCWEVAREYGRPVVIMEPVKGGLLAEPPDGVMDILRETEPNRTAAEWALRFAMNREGIITALSGMRSIEQVRQNIATLKSLTPLTQTELETLDRARTALSELIAVPCTGCQYCTKKCPLGMNIPGIMQSLNMRSMYGGDHGVGWYFWEARIVKGSACLHCHQCEGVCPQHIDIVNRIEQAVELFEGPKTS